MRKFVYQTQEKGCGIACVKMALIERGKNRGFSHLEEPDASHGLSLAQLIDFGNDHGLPLSAFRLSSPSEIVEMDDFPILLLAKEGKTEHMVYVYGRRQNVFFVMDPSHGIERWKKEQLLKRSTGIFMTAGEFVPTGEVLPKRKRLLPAFLKWGLCFLGVLPMLCFALGALWLGFGQKEAGGLAFLGLGVLFAAIAGWGRKWVLDSIGKRFEPDLLVSDPVERERRLRHVEAFKRAYISGLPSVISSTFLSVSLAVIGIVRDVSFAWAIGIGLALAIPLSLFLMEMESRRKRNLAENEADFLSVEAEPKGLKKRYAKVKEAVGRLMNVSLFHASSSVVISAVVTGFSLFFLGRLDLANVLHWWLLLSIILTRLDGVNNGFQSLKEEAREEAYLRGFQKKDDEKAFYSRSQTRAKGLE